jgi:hypothetical protein
MSAGERWGRGAASLLPDIGGIAGGMVGAGAGLGWGSVPGAVLGAAAGGGLGKIAQDEIDELVFGDRPKSAMEEAKNIAGEGALQGAYEVGGRLIEIPLKAGLETYRAARATARGTPPIRMLSSEVRGVEPTWAEKFLKGSIFTSKIMDGFRVAQERETKAAVTGLANQIGTFAGTKRDLGELVQRGVESWEKNFRNTQNAMYAHIDQRAGRVQASTANLKTFARQELQKLNQVGAVLDPNVLSGRRAMLEHIVNNAPDQVSFTTMKDIRSDLLAESRKFKAAMAGKEAGLAKHLAGLADDSMEDAARWSGQPGLLNDVRNANAYTRFAHEQFEQKLVADVIKSSPENISTLIAQTTKTGRAPVSIEGTQALMGMLAPGVRDKVQRQVLMDAMRQASVKPTGAFKEGRFAEKFLELGDERGQAIFGQNWQTVKELGERLRRIGGSAGLGSSASLANVTQFKNMVQVMTGLGALGSAGYSGVKGGPGAAASTLAAEGIPLATLAYVMTSPRLAFRLLQAMRGAEMAARGGIPMAVSFARVAADEQRRRDEARTQGEPVEEPPPDVAAQAQQEQAQPQAATLPELQTQAAGRNPAADGNPPRRGYQKTYINRQTGHRIGTDDGATYYDIETGRQVQ